MENNQETEETEEKKEVKERTHYIYKITNLINNKIYIGQTVDLKARWLKHVASSRTKDKKQSFYLQKSINKYGKENFKHEIIDQCQTLKEADDKEIYWIAYFDSTNTKIGMNLTKGGGGNLGYKMPEHQKEILRKINKGKKLSEEQRKILSIANKGKKLSEEHRKIISKANKGRPLSDEHKKKISESNKGKPKSEEHKIKLRAYCGDKSQNYGLKRSKEHIEIIRKTHTGKILSKYTRDKIRETNLKLKISVGEKNPSAKLSENDVILIRELFKNGEKRKDIALKFNISRSVIERIVSYKIWRHVK